MYTLVNNSFGGLIVALALVPVNCHYSQNTNMGTGTLGTYGSLETLLQEERPFLSP